MKKLIYILSPILALGLFSACEQQSSEDLQGTWELVSKPNNETDFKWTFKGAKVYIEATDNRFPYDGSFDTCSIGNYFLKNGVLTIAASANFCNYSSYVGDWDVQNLDVGFLTIRQDGSSNDGTLWYEFIKITQ
jgi:hypothetical protein